MPRIWGTQSNSRFIELYREQRCLWKVEDPGYRDKYCRRRAIQQIINGMALPDLTPMEVRKRIKSLRATFLIELKKIMESLQSDDGERVYKPKLSWFDQMAEFISYTEEQLLGRGKIQVEPIITKTEHESDEDNVEETVFLVDNSNDWDTQEDVLSTVSASSNIPKKRVRVDDETSSSHVIDEIRTVLSQLTVANNAPARDEFENFGIHVASQLRLLSDKGSIKAQNEIQSVLTKYRLQDLQAKKSDSRLGTLYLKTSEEEEDISS